MTVRGIYHRSAAYLGFRIVTLEVCCEAAYLLLRLAAELAGGSVGYDVRLFGPLIQFWVLVFQVGLLIYLLARWVNDTYELREAEIVVKSGLIPRKEVAYPYNNVQSVTVKVSLLGQILGAGEVSAFIPTLGHEINFPEISRPHEFADQLKHALPYPEKGQFIVRR